MSCALPGIASGIGIDPTLPRDGTDFITLEGVIRIHVWLRLFCACVLRDAETDLENSTAVKSCSCCELTSSSAG